MKMSVKYYWKQRSVKAIEEELDMLQGTRFDDKDTKSNKELYEKLMILLK